MKKKKIIENLKSSAEILIDNWCVPLKTESISLGINGIYTPVWYMTFEKIKEIKVVL